MNNEQGRLYMLIIQPQISFFILNNQIDLAASFFHLHLPRSFEQLSSGQGEIPDRR